MAVLGRIRPLRPPYGRFGGRKWYRLAGVAQFGQVAQIICSYYSERMDYVLVYIVYILL